MFKKHRLELRMVNDSKSPKTDETSEPKPSLDYVQIVRDATEFIGTKVIIGVLAYVAVDTLRQVIVKVTPEN